MKDRDILTIAISLIIIIILFFSMGYFVGSMSNNTRLEGAEMHHLGMIDCKTFSDRVAKCVFTNPNKEE